MTTEVSKLLNDVSDFVKFVKSKAVFFDDLIQKLKKSISIVREQIEVYLASQKASLPQNLLQKFPDVKPRVLSNVSRLIDEELSEITKYVDQLRQLSTDLRKMYDKIEKWMSQLNWNEYLQYFSAFSRITEWAEKCWKYFYFIYVSLENGLKSVSMDGSNPSALKLVETVDGVDKRYIFENPVTDMFQMLKIDFSSRSRITVTSATGSRTSTT